MFDYTSVAQTHFSAFRIGKKGERRGRKERRKRGRKERRKRGKRKTGEGKQKGREKGN